MEDQRVDLLVVGAGLAGLTAALTAAEDGTVALVTAGRPDTSSASWRAQGGIAAAVGDDDSPGLHAADTLGAGRGLCRPRAVRVLVQEAASRVADLAEQGVEFDPELGLEGGHSRRRIVHAGGAQTGEHVARALWDRAVSHPNVEVVEGTRVLALREQDGRCVGAITEYGPIAARATLLATGGMAALWERTTNPPAAIGDGVLLAWRAGAALADLELVQFHPTALATNGLLLSEALRGEGALLLDGQGRRFTDELAPRDVVARAVGAQSTALLDLRPVDRGRFPALMETIAREGWDPAAEPVPVAPAAHFTMGGVVTDLDGHTTLPGLYAAGECACTGVHGANRLASNSLLECLVFGRRAALAARQEPELPLRLPSPSPSEPLPAVSPAIRRGMWDHAGLVRDAAGLEELREAPHPLARLVAEAALAREESRGGHFRADCPAEAPDLALHIVHRRGQEPVFERWT